MASNPHDLKSRQALQQALDGNGQCDFLSQYMTSDKLEKRWHISSPTVLKLEKEGKLKAYRLMGKAHQKLFKVADIDAIERAAADPLPDEPEQADTSSLRDRLEQLESLVSKLAVAKLREPTPATTSAAPAAPTHTTPKIEPVADARRRQAAFAAFDNIVSHDDKFRAVLERVFVGRLDTDPTFNADAVESLVASERSNYDQVAEMVNKEKTDATMKALFPTRDELAAESNEIVPPVPTFVGFGLGKGSK